MDKQQIWFNTHQHTLDTITLANVLVPKCNLQPCTPHTHTYITKIATGSKVINDITLTMSQTCVRTQHMLNGQTLIWLAPTTLFLQLYTVTCWHKLTCTYTCWMFSYLYGGVESLHLLKILILNNLYCKLWVFSPDRHNRSARFLVACSETCIHHTLRESLVYILLRVEQRLS